MNAITYKNDDHQKLFEKIIEKKNQNNYTLMSAIYLLTADLKLWNCVKKDIMKNKIHFENVQLGNTSVNGYTLFCCAKDLYCGTKHLTVADLADKTLVSQSQFELICNAMAIKRFGLEKFN